MGGTKAFCGTFLLWLELGFARFAGGVIRNNSIAGCTVGRVQRDIITLSNNRRQLSRPSMALCTGAQVLSISSAEQFAAVCTGFQMLALPRLVLGLC